MENKTVENVQGNNTIEVYAENERNHVEKRERTEKTAGNNANVEKSLEKQYDAVSKNGDTLELSDMGKAMEKRAGGKSEAPVKNVFTDLQSKLSDSALSGYSESKLRQLYAKKEITKQQFDKAMKKKR